MVKREDTLFQLFGRIHNHIYANDGLSPQEAFNEFLKLLLLKLEVEGRGTEFKQDFFVSEKEYSDLLDGKSIGLKRKIEKIFEQVKKDYSEIFHKAEVLNLKETTLAFVIKNLQEINLGEIDSDVKGMAFQKFIYSNQRGSRGQFLTPDPIIELAVNIVSPKIEDKIIDPACGTAGFLIRSIRFLNKKNPGRLKDFFKNLRGIEITPSVIRLAKVRMILEGDGHTGITNADSLLDFEALDKLSNESLRGKFDLVLTNPPFGSQGKIADKTYLKRFELGHIWKRQEDHHVVSTELQNTQTPDVLFIERGIELLKTGGKMAIVLPNGIFENKTSHYIREYIRSKCKILGVVSLPSKTFIPHGTGVKTSVLFLEKTESPITEKYDIFFSIVENVGYAGNKNGSPVFKKDKSGNEVLDEDISEVIKKFNEFKNGQLKEQDELGFIISSDEIDDRLDAEFYRPRFKKLIDTLTRQGARPLGELVEIKSKKADILKNKNKEIAYIEITNVSSESSEIVGSQKMKVSQAPSRASYELNKGDIITAVSGISTGTENQATAMVTTEFEGAICTNGFRVLVPKRVDPYYLLYYLKTDLFLSQMLRYRTGAAIPSVIEDDLKKVLILMPNEKKLKEISDQVKASFELKENAKKIMQDVFNIQLI